MFKYLISYKSELIELGLVKIVQMVNQYMLNKDHIKLIFMKYLWI